MKDVPLTQGKMTFRGSDGGDESHLSDHRHAASSSDPDDAREVAGQYMLLKAAERMSSSPPPDVIL